MRSLLWYSHLLTNVTGKETGNFTAMCVTVGHYKSTPHTVMLQKSRGNTCCFYSSLSKTLQNTEEENRVKKICSLDKETVRTVEKQLSRASKKI